MSLISFLLALLTFLPVSGGAPSKPSSYGQLKGAAEESYAEKSFRRAHELYEQASKLPALAPDERRWIDFRLPDTAWRTDAASPASDPTARNEAQTALEQLILKSGDDHDRVWAEANESLGDLHALHPYSRDYNAAQEGWNAALDWWEGSDDLPLARRRYLGIVWRLSEGGLAPKELLVKALGVAESPTDRDHARFLLSQKLLTEQKAESIERGLEHLDVLINEGRKGAYYDEALFAYASQLSNAGVVIVPDNGESGFRKDYVKALDLFRRIVAEYQPGQSPRHAQATSQIEQITQPALAVFTGSNFLPSSQQQVTLTWRNVTSIELTLAAVDLTRDVQPEKNLGNWVDHLQREGKPLLRHWIFETGDRGEHIPGNKAVRIEPKLAPGAYVITARNGRQSSRQLLLISDTAILTHAVEGHFKIFVADVMSGAPVAGARVRIVDGRGSDPASSIHDGETNANGVADIRLTGTLQDQVLITASKGSRQAYDTKYLYAADASAPSEEWRIYTFTDRPVYRPGETVHWKIIARTRTGPDWTTPAGQKLDWEIISPRGDKITSGVADLNAFGSFWAELPVTAEMPLGGYTVRFRYPSDDAVAGGGSLFRIEEYKLPEFRVSVSTPEEDGKKKRYRLGDTIEASVEASYYFGGPVANATVEVDIETSPYSRIWHPWHKYDWFYQEPDSESGGDSEPQHQTLNTDGNGHAVVHIDTNRDGGATRYTISARVTDASRREVTGSGDVAVMKQRYTVNGHPEHYLRLPNERVSIDFNAADANEEPIRTTGTVRVFRRIWEEVWTDPAGRDVSVPEVERARAASTLFPPPGWRQRLASYRDEEVTTSKVDTDAKGNATFTFTPSRTGYYVAKWTSEDRDGKGPLRARDLVTAETAVWVTEHATNEVGYHAAGLDLVVDQDTVRAGATMPVMIATPSSGRWVVVSTTTDDIDQTQVLHLDGTVKLLELPIDRHHMPNFFITASSIFDRTLATETKEIVVPPVEKFVKVEVQTDRENYEPRQKGTVTVTTRDAAGKPVPAEVSLAVADESVTAISQDTAGDPRQFFYNDVRTSGADVTSSAQSQHYVRLVEDEKGALVDEQVKRMRRDAIPTATDALLLPFFEVDFQQSVAAGVAGGVGGLPSPPAPPPPRSLTESITVTQAPVAEMITVSKKDLAPTTVPTLEVVVRHDFRSTAFWKPDVITGADGKATVSFDYPEALTTWRATARAVTADSQFGMASATARTNMPLIVRLEGPRFFVTGDRTVVSAVINNNTAEVRHVTPSLEVEGLTLSGRVNGNATIVDVPVVDVPANGETRVDWTVVADHAGPAKLRVTGRDGALSDAMEKPFTVYEHGIDKLVARSGKLRGTEARVRLELPSARRATTLSVQISPSLAVTMLDALPYLIDYPYGCTEQTMSRFLPAAIVARTLAANGLDPADIEGRMFGGIESGSAAATHPKGKTDLHKLEAITAASMNRLYDFQHDDGGWGWWKEGESDLFMTGYVVWGFAVAKEGGLAVNDEALESAAKYLDARLVAIHGDGANEAWILHALTAWNRVNKVTAPSQAMTKAFDDAYEHRERLTAYSRALLALAAHDLGDAAHARVLVRNLEDGVQIDRTPDQSVLVHGGSSAAETMATAHWGSDSFWWYWYDGPVETTSFALQALVAVDPKNALIEPVMNWLVKNRRGAQWNNTRDTAIALLGLNDYLRTSGELKGDTGFELAVNGHAVASKTVTATGVLSAPSRFDIDPSFTHDGINEISIRRTHGSAEAPLYFSAEARFVSVEEPVKAAGNEIFVRRDYFKLVPHPTLLKGVVYETLPLLDGGSVESGERVEVVITVESKNDYDYLLFEDLKPAGLEAIALQSGGPLAAQELRSGTVTRKFAGSATPPGEQPTVMRRDPSAELTGRTASIYQELRDRKVAMFLDHLPQGIWEIRYTLRAEVPGSFHALPLLAQAMYVPEVRGNGEEVRIEVTAKK